MRVRRYSCCRNGQRFSRPTGHDIQRPALGAAIVQSCPPPNHVNNAWDDVKKQKNQGNEKMTFELALCASLVTAVSTNSLH
jgi:hypothetical protein